MKISFLKNLFIKFLQNRSFIQIVVLSSLLLMITNKINAQEVELSKKEKECIEQEKKYTKQKLDSAHIWGGFNTYPTDILTCIYERILYSSENYDFFNNQLIYTQELRDKLLSLLNNEWQDWELEIVAQKHIKRLIPSLKIIAEKLAKTDTLRISSEILDSILISKYDELKDEYTSKLPNNYTSYVKLASYIEDPRFRKPIEKNYKTDPEFYSICLARMGIEPYLSTETKKLHDFFKKEEYWKIYESINEIIRTQESLKILSECLLVDFIYNPFSEGDYQQPFYRDVAETLLILLANNEVRELFSKNEQKLFYTPFMKRNTTFTKEHAKRLYDWMQKNYGKYKIRPF